MNGLLGEIAKKLVDRWLTLLVLPGAFYLGIATAAHSLGQAHALDLTELITRISGWIKSPVATSSGGQIVLLIAVLVGSAGVGLGGQAFGSAIELLVLAANWRGWLRPARQLVQRRVNARQARWDRAYTRYRDLYAEAEQTRRAGSHPDPENRQQRYAAYQTWNRIGIERPERPTWNGDRIHAVAVRVDRDLHVNLASVWPSLWLVLPDTVRADITTARQNIARSTTLAGWATLYALLTWWWWPAGPAAVVLLITARQRTRTAVNTYALLLEAAFRLHLKALAEQVGVDHDSMSDTDLGDSLNHRLLTPPPNPRLPQNPG